MAHGPSPKLTGHPVMTEDALKLLGSGVVAYVKTVRSEDVRTLYPHAPELQPGLTLYALHAADGTPILVTDTREAAFANAMCQELQAVNVH